MTYKRLAVVIGTPLIFAGLFITIERSFPAPFIATSLAGHLTDTQSKLLSMSDDLSKFFIGLCTSLLGAIAFYLGLGRDRKVELDTYAGTLIVGVSLSAIFSIFFGHLWAAGLRGQLVNDILDFRASQLVWPERLQYLCFIASLCWFGLLVLHIEFLKNTASPPSASSKETKG